MSEPQTFLVDGTKLTGGVSRSSNPRAVVILCHGIPSGGPEDPDDAGYPGLADAMSAEAFDVWWFNFRGARDSEGTFTLGGWVEDLHAVVSHVQLDGLKTIVVGSSAGGAVALTAAAESSSIRAVATLASPAVWTRDPDAFRETLLEHARRVGLVDDPNLDEEAWWAEFETNPPFLAVELMGGRPLLVVQGTEDEVVPPFHAEQLFRKASFPKELVMIRGAGHQLRRNPEAVRAVLDWVGSVV